MFSEEKSNLRSLKVYNFFNSHDDLKLTHAIVVSYSSHVFLSNFAYTAIIFL